MRPYVIVWSGLIVIVAAEVAATFAHLAAGTQLAVLLALAVLEAGLALLYFITDGPLLAGCGTSPAPAVAGAVTARACDARS